MSTNETSKSMMTLTASSAGAPTITSIQLLEHVNEARAEFDESQVRHNDFLSRCKNELEGEPYETFVESAKGRAPAFEAIRMTADQCRLVAMRESKGVRRRVLARLKELEARAAAGDFQIPQTFAQALLLAARQSEELDQKNAQLAIAAPKAEALDRIAVADGAMCITNAAKTINMAPKVLFSWMHANNWIYRRQGSTRWIAYQHRIKSGLLDHKVETVKRSDGSEKVVEQVLVTAKGLTKLAEVAA